MVECGQVLSEITPAGVNAIFQRFRDILHEGSIEKRVQYTIEKLFAIRKSKFREHSGVIPELDLIEEQDKITHNVSLDDELLVEEDCNLFKFDPDFEEKEAQWDEIKKEILGQHYQDALNEQGAGKLKAEGEESSEDEQAVQHIDHANEV